MNRSTSSSSDVGNWFAFLTTACGITPIVTAQKYAEAFVQNRITIDMRSDLNKEYLRELGVTALGDVIRILKHAGDPLPAVKAVVPQRQTQPPAQAQRQPPVVANTNVAQFRKAAPVLPQPVPVAAGTGRRVVSITTPSSSKAAFPSSNIARRLGPPARIDLKQGVFDRLGRGNDGVDSQEESFGSRSQIDRDYTPLNRGGNTTRFHVANSEVATTEPRSKRVHLSGPSSLDTSSRIQTTTKRYFVVRRTPDGSTERVEVKPGDALYERAKAMGKLHLASPTGVSSTAIRPVSAIRPAPAIRPASAITHRLGTSTPGMSSSSSVWRSPTKVWEPNRGTSTTATVSPWIYPPYKQSAGPSHVTASLSRSSLATRIGTRPQGEAAAAKTKAVRPRISPPRSPSREPRKRISVISVEDDYTNRSSAAVVRPQRKRISAPSDDEASNDGDSHFQRNYGKAPRFDYRHQY